MCDEFKNAQTITVRVACGVHKCDCDAIATRVRAKINVFIFFCEVVRGCSQSRAWLYVLICCSDVNVYVFHVFCKMLWQESGQV